MAAWADLEHSLSDWFDRAIQTEGGKDVNSEGIFYSARSFLGRADMLKAASHSNLLSSDERKFIRAALKCARDYNTFRSKLAHRMTVRKQGFGPDEDGTYLHEGNDPFGRNENLPAISAEHLSNATQHIDALRWVISITAVSGGIEPQEGLRLIRLLPKDPHLAVDARLLAEIFED